jgi:hypothetical protein
MTLWTFQKPNGSNTQKLTIDLKIKSIETRGIRFIKAFTIQSIIRFVFIRSSSTFLRGYYLFSRSTYVLFTCLCIYNTSLYYSSCFIHSSSIHCRLIMTRAFAHGAIFSLGIIIRNEVKIMYW